ncbi:MAG: gliding motility-associated C-terminal domain-containing protein [Lewinellaceae bacterium]|nr:gliding motility-associated C-terminal domain-containing protein [Lewinellaceae bacterium]
MKNSLYLAVISIMLLTATSVRAQLELSFDFEEPSCHGYIDGSATALPSGGTAPYSYLWSNGQTTQIISGIGSGIFSVTVNDANNETIIGTVTVTDHPVLELDIVSISPSCTGSNNGSATVQASGGVPPYTYFWSPGNFSGPTASGLAPGAYSVKVRDSKFCETALLLNIPEINGLDVTLIVQSATCTGVDDGIVTAFVDPPGTYIYEWNVPPFQGPNQITGLAANTVVTVTVTDPGSGCTGTATTIVGAHNSVDVDVQTTDVMCASDMMGSATAIASGGVPDYTYQWFIPPSGPQIGSDSIITGLNQGAYMVSVTDSRGCTAISVANIGVEAGPQALIEGLTLVECGTVESIVQFTNVSVDQFGTIVSWEWELTLPGGIQTFNNVNPLQLSLPVGAAGSIKLTVTSDNGCMADTMKNFIVPGIPDISLSTGPVAVDCANGPIPITVNGGQPHYSYTWSPLAGLILGMVPPNVIANPDTTTTYQLIANDQGCMDTVSVTIVRVENPIDLMVQDSVIHTCDSIATLVATANVPNVYWTDADWNVLGNPPTNPITVVLQADSSVFHVIAQDSLGCADTLSVTVFQHSVDISVDPDMPDTLCANTDVQLGIINNNPGDILTYTWSANPPLVLTGANTPNPVVVGPVGSYDVTVTVENQYGCVDSLIIPLIFADMVNIADAIEIDLCNGTSVTFTNHSGLSGLWEFGDGDTSTLVNPVHIYTTGGTYTVVFTPDNLQCAMPWDSTIIVKDSVLGAPQISYEYVNCIDSAGVQFYGMANVPVKTWHWTFSAGEPDSSDLQNPIIVFTEEGSVMATLVITDSMGCSSSTTINFDVYIIQDSIPDMLEFCLVDSIQLNADGYDSTATYVWTSNPIDSVFDANSPNPWVSPGVVTTYTVTISQDTFCSVTYEVLVTPLHGPDVTVNVPDHICEGMPVKITVTNNIPGDTLTYQWTSIGPLIITEPDDSMPFISGPAGNYILTLTVTNQNNCTQTLDIPIHIIQSVDIQDSIYIDLCQGLEVSFFNNSGIGGIWDFGDGDTSTLQNPVHTYADTGQYHVVFTPTLIDCVWPWDTIIIVTDTPLDTPVISYEYLNCIDSAQIQFYGMSNTSNVTWSWTFSGGSPATSMEQNPIVTFHEEQQIQAIVKITTVNGCMASDTLDLDVVIIQDSMAMELFVCVGDSVQLNSDGYDSTATYVWTSNPPDLDFDVNSPNPWVSPDTATIYSVTISQDTVCTLTIDVLVTPVPAPDVTPVLPDHICEGMPGLVGVTNNNPGDTLTYEWTTTDPVIISSPQDSFTTVSGSAGDYVITVTVTNQYNCSLTLDIPITIIPSIDIQDSISIDLCNGLEVSFFNNSTIGGVWDFGDGNTSSDHNPVHTYGAEGQYHVTFTPGFGLCVWPWDTMIIVIDNPLDTPVISYEYLNCIDSAQIQFFGMSNTPMISWMWTFSGGDPLSSVEQNPVVNFLQEQHLMAVVKVTAENNCMASDTVELDVVIIQDSMQLMYMLCEGDSVQLNADGYDSTATYVWTSVPNDVNFDPNSPNPWVSPDVSTDYTVTITQDTFCSVTYIVSVVIKPKPDVTPNFPDTICTGVPVQMGLTNNIPTDTLTYMWSADPPLIITGADTDSPILEGPAGDYDITVTVTNQYNCSLELIIPIHIEESIDVQDSITIDLCNGLEVSFFNNSGLSGIWEFGDGDTSTLQNPVHTYADTGQYHVVFTPLNYICTWPWDTLINVQDSAIAVPVINYFYLSCVDSAQIQFLGSSNHQIDTWFWTFSGGSPDSAFVQNPVVTFTQEGTITAILKVTDVNGCMASDTQEIEILIIQDSMQLSHMICAGDSVQLNADGFDDNAGYSWTSDPVDPNFDSNSPNPWVSPLVTTVYSVTISQDTFCSVTYDVTVMVKDGPDVTLEVPDTTCANLDTQLSIMNNNPGDTLTFEWTVDPPLQITGADTDMPVVNGPAGDYTITVVVTNQNMCSVTLTAMMHIQDSLNIQDSITLDLCDGLNVSFFNNSGLIGLWDFGDGDTSTAVNPIHSYAMGGSYQVSFTPTDYLCVEAWDSLIIVLDEPLDTPMIANNYIICIDSAQIQFMGTSNNADVHWDWTFSSGTPATSTEQNPIITFFAEDTITVTLMVTDTNNCMAVATLELPVEFISDSIENMRMFCLGDSLYLNPDGYDSTATYVWTSLPVDSNLVANDPNPLVSPVVETVYTVTLSENSGCSVAYQVTVVPKDAAVLTLPDDMLVCNDSLLTLIATGNGTIFAWSDSSDFDPIFSTNDTVMVTPVRNGKYYVRMQTIFGCVAIDSISVNNGSANIDVAPYDDNICLGESTNLQIENLNPEDTLDYVWTPNLPNVPNPSVMPEVASDYHVVVTNQFGCTDELDFHVDVTTVSVKAEITGRDTICTRGSTTLLATPTSNVEPVSIFWTPTESLDDPASRTPTASPSHAETYVVTAMTEDGCVATDEVSVKFCLDQCLEPYIFVPNTFTPNNDGINDHFIVRGANITDMVFMVWNRWGEKVYETTDINAQGWDGSFKGADATPDSYAWYLRATCGDGGSIERQGNVTLLK